ncbi:MAG: response regulator transcription factor [Ekhidna sp.]
MSKHILVVDDEPNMRRGLKDNLEFEGYSVSEAQDGQDALEILKTVTPDLIILDVMMPKLSGLEVCKQLRRSGDETPIILLTAKGEEIDKVLGLEMGADDYVQKPFSVRELTARVKAILRRNKPVSDQTDFTFGLLSVDFKKYEAIKNGQEEKLSHKEFEILQYLHDHANEIVDRQELLKNVWQYNEQPTTRTVDNFIVKLRQKIEEDPSNPKLIITVHGTGYKLIQS